MLPYGQKSYMTSQVTNRREGGFKSCRARNRKLYAFTQKELDTVRMAQKLLGAPPICGGCAWAGRGCGGSQRSQIRPHVARNVRKWQKNRRFHTIFWLLNHRKRRFLLQSTLQHTHPRRFFEEYINFKIFSYLRH